MRVNFSDCLLVWRSRFAEISTTVCTRGIFTVFTDKLLRVGVWFAVDQRVELPQERQPWWYRWRRGVVVASLV